MYSTSHPTILLFIGQEGTLWWHAHSSWLRATVYGALIIRPRQGHSYPFIKPYKEVPLLLGEWWNANVVDVENQAQAIGAAPNESSAYTINGLPGDLYSCSQKQTYKLKVKQGKTYLLRIINAALNEQQFFKIANHRFTVVALDAGYTEPYDTDVVVVAPGQTTDVLFRTNQKVGSYYMVASPYHTLNGPFNNSTTRGVVVYHGASSITPPKMPNLPTFNDTPTAHKFYTNITGLVNGPHWVPVPCNVDEHMSSLLGRFSMLEAFFRKVHGVYTKDFPNKPPIEFDYTNPATNQNAFLAFAPKSTKVKTLMFNSTVEIVLQNTAILVVESHPIHIHGFNFHVLAQGFGNYNSTRDEPKFNLVNPQMRNTIAVPVGGWAVIRFQANNPGMWFVHCHFDVHVPWGLAMAFEVENGPTPSSTLPPPPVDFPKC
ncbi:Multicopper oxidase, type 1 [Sesbania bispinosa]|nr:Multicopper oxidase, type 1 [Sesbania bispinosa]